MAATVKSIHPGLADLLKNTEHWNQALSRYLVTRDPRVDVPDDEENRRILRMANVLKTLLQFYLQRARRHENWDPLLFSVDPYGMTVVARAKKQEHEYHFGIELNEFFLRTMIHSPRYVKFTGMGFWRFMVELDGLGALTFEENEGVIAPPGNRAFAHVLKVGKSPVYRLIRNLVLMEAKGPEIGEGGPGKDFGWLHVAWRCSTGWEDLLRNGAAAFQRLYKMNYILYRQQYLYDRTLMKRIRQQQEQARS